jgi:hypothetical protein
VIATSAEGVFPAFEAARFRELVLPDTWGRFPGNMHELFGMTPEAFAQTTHLQRQTDRIAGHTRTFWVVD